MGWFRKSRQEEEEKTASLVASMATAFATALGSVLTAQTEGIKQQGSFLNTLQDLSARKAAQVLGSKGGRTTQSRKKAAKKAAAAEQQCVLCLNPMHRGTTLEQVNFHRMHEASVSQEPLALDAPSREEEESRGN